MGSSGSHTTDKILYEEFKTLQTHYIRITDTTKHMYGVSNQYRQRLNQILAEVMDLAEHLLEHGGLVEVMIQKLQTKQLALKQAKVNDQGLLHRFGSEVYTDLSKFFVAINNITCRLLRIQIENSEHYKHQELQRSLRLAQKLRLESPVAYLFLFEELHPIMNISSHRKEFPDCGSTGIKDLIIKQLDEPHKHDLELYPYSDSRLESGKKERYFMAVCDDNSYCVVRSFEGYSKTEIWEVEDHDLKCYLRPKKKSVLGARYAVGHYFFIVIDNEIGDECIFVKRKGAHYKTLEFYSRLFFKDSIPTAKSLDKTTCLLGRAFDISVNQKFVAFIVNGDSVRIGFLAEGLYMDLRLEGNRRILQVLCLKSDLILVFFSSGDKSAIFSKGQLKREIVLEDKDSERVVPILATKCSHGEYLGIFGENFGAQSPKFIVYQVKGSTGALSYQAEISLPMESSADPSSLKTIGYFGDSLLFGLLRSDNFLNVIRFEISKKSVSLLRQVQLETGFKNMDQDRVVGWDILEQCIVVVGGNLKALVRFFTISEPGSLMME